MVNWVSATALCLARQKIKYTLFVELNRLTVKCFYDYIGGKRWRHFRLLAVDGSALNLPPSDELLERFGHHHTNSIGTKIPQARVSFLCDVKNHITIDAQIESFRVSEQSMFNEHLQHIGKGDMLTADANYGHFRIFKTVKNTGAEFCIRMGSSTTVVKEFLASCQQDKVMLWEPTAKSIKNCEEHGVDSSPMKIRLVRIELTDTITEVIAVSLTDQDTYSYDDIKDLYDNRWAVEEEIKKYMQRLMLEFFSSKKTNGVLQDFYANVIVLNYVGIIAQPVYEQIERDDKTNKRTHNYQTNWTAALSDVKQRVVLLFLKTKNRVTKIIESIQESFGKIIGPIRPDRKFPRDKRKKGSRCKAYMNYKPI